MGLVDMANHFLNLSQDQLYVLAKLMTMSAADFVEQWFESDPLKATLSASGIIGTFLGPRSPGTAYVLLHHYMGEIDGAYRAWGFHKGGTGGLADVLVAARPRPRASRCAATPVWIMSSSTTAGLRVSCWRMVMSSRPLWSCPAWIPSKHFCELVNPNELPDDLG